MCVTCGCGGQASILGRPIKTAQAVNEKRIFRPVSSAVSVSEQSVINLERNILEKNDNQAEDNRQLLKQHKVAVFNLMSSPGSGKTSLLVTTLNALKSVYPLAVIEGDQQTDFDAKRIEQTGVSALQINTGKGCHLDAAMVGSALQQISLPQEGMLFIENVGNLVCPAAFDLGEHKKVVVLSVTEGEDKPLKYPDMFRVADVMIINKSDLLPYVNFNVERAVAYARQVKPNLPYFLLSATQGDGMADWLNWLEEQHGIFTA